MAVPTLAQLTTAFPEFSNSSVYAPATVDFWLGEANAIFLPAEERLGSRFLMAQLLYAAHMLVIGKRNASVAAGGSSSGMITGPIQSKTVGPISASYGNLTDIFYKNGGFWNTTMYGLQLYQIMRTFASGGMYVPGHGRFGP